MTVVLLSGGLTFLVGLLILRPFSVTDGRLHVRADAPDDDRRRELLRQLRDLDDDLAAGKLTRDDHARLRDPVEREAAAFLARKAQRPAGGTAAVTPGGTAPVTPGGTAPVTSGGTAAVTPGGASVNTAAVTSGAQFGLCRSSAQNV